MVDRFTFSSLLPECRSVSSGLAPAKVTPQVSHSLEEYSVLSRRDNDSEKLFESVYLLVII